MSCSRESRRGWASDGEPAQSTYTILDAVVRKVAAGSLFLREWPARGNRHTAAMAIGWFLARVGWSREDIVSFVEIIVPGLPKLKEIFGEDGREWRLNFELKARSLKVTFAGEIETTRTRSIKYDGGIIEPRLRGADWVMVDDGSDMFTEWARPARPAEPLITRKEWRASARPAELAARVEGDE
jgi:hypothetical protein